ncbi:hypothetical protein ILYODFUR_030872 [Ilyodon furcidens]|uniref:Uncharacterized protein n=1 Tax=Ilyodon furcidens TaxID=33524 RepID=A0ABV0TPU8_9TELE
MFYLWWKTKTAHHSEYRTLALKHAGGSIILWECFFFSRFSSAWTTVAQVVGVHPVTGGLPVRCVLGKALHPPCLLMVVRGPCGANGMAASILSVCLRAAVATMSVVYRCQCVNEWITDCSVKHFGVF